MIKILLFKESLKLAYIYRHRAEKRDNRCYYETLLFSKYISKFPILSKHSNLLCV